MAQDERVGLHGRRRGAGVRDQFDDREHVFVVDRDDPLEDETRAIVPGQRHRLRWGQRLPIGRPHRVEARSFCPCRAYKPGLGPIGVRRAGRREQSDIRALGVDGLVIILENDIVDLAALKIDRAADARRIDDNTGAGRQDLTDSPGGLPYRRAGRRRRGRRAGRQSRRGAGWLRFGWRRWLIGLIGLHLRLVLALIQRTGVEILPGGHDQDRQRDREKQVSRVLGFHVRASLSLAVRLAGRRPRPSASRAGRRERQCGHHRRAQRNGGPAPRAGPSARSRDLRSASRGAAARRASFSRLRTRLRSTAPPTPLVTVSPTRAPGTASFPVSSRRRDCSVKVVDRCPAPA